MIHGKNLILTINGQVIAAAVTCDVTVDTDFISIASPVSGTWTDTMPTRSSWSASCDGLCATMDKADDLINLQTSRTAVTLRFYDTEAGIHRKGSAYIKSVRLSGTLRGIAQYGVSFVGSGELETDYGTEINMSALPHNSISHRNIDCDGETFEIVETAAQDCDVYCYKLTISQFTIVHISTDSSNSCLFLHNNSYTNLSAIVDGCDNIHFAETHIQHVHGIQEKYVSLLPGEYTITMDYDINATHHHVYTIN